MLAGLHVALALAERYLTFVAPRGRISQRHIWVTVLTITKFGLIELRSPRDTPVDLRARSFHFSRVPAQQRVKIEFRSQLL